MGVVYEGESRGATMASNFSLTVLDSLILVISHINLSCRGNWQKYGGKQGPWELPPNVCAGGQVACVRFR